MDDYLQHPHFSNVSLHLNLPETFFKNLDPRLLPQIAVLVALGWDLSACISYKHPGDAVAVGLRTTL